MQARLPEDSMNWLRRMALDVATKVGIRNSDDTIAELIQVGALAMLENLHRVDLRKGAALQYLRMPVRRAMHDLVSEGAIAIPTRIRVEARRIRKTADRLGVLYGRTASMAEIAEELGMKVAKVHRILSRDHHFVSADAGSEVGMDLLRRQASTDLCPLGGLLAQELQERLEELMGELSEREAWILEKHYDLENTGERKTLAALGQEVGVSTARVHQIKDAALKRIRHGLAN